MPLIIEECGFSCLVTDEEEDNMGSSFCGISEPRCSVWAILKQPGSQAQTFPSSSRCFSSLGTNTTLCAKITAPRGLRWVSRVHPRTSVCEFCSDSSDLRAPLSLRVTPVQSLLCGGEAAACGAEPAREADSGSPAGQDLPCPQSVGAGAGIPGRTGASSGFSQCT